MSWENFGNAPKILREVVRNYSGPDAEQVREFHSHLEKKARQASIDKLTGLYSRDYMEDELIEELERCTPVVGRRRSDTGEHLPVSVGLLDLDRFKEVNDELGHLEGDRVLSDAAIYFLEALAEAFGSLRKSDSVGRYGGDEMQIIMPETELLYACLALNRIKNKIHDQEDLHDVTLSAGLTSSDIVGVPLVLTDSGISLVSRYFEHEGNTSKNNLMKSIRKYSAQRATRPSDVISMLDNVYKLLKMTERNPDMIKSDKYNVLRDLMLKYADMALYRAKKEEGKNMICCYGKYGLFL